MKEICLLKDRLYIEIMFCIYKSIYFCLLCHELTVRMILFILLQVYY